MRSFKVQRVKAAVVEAACLPILSGTPRVPRHYPRCLLPSVWHRHASAAPRSSGSRPAGYRRQYHHSGQSCSDRSPGNAQYRSITTSRHATKDTNTGVEEPTPGTPDAYAEQPDGERSFAFKYIPIEDVERLEKYCIGGYHPIAIGDTLKDVRYQIVNKLGHGGYSTIWIAQDKDAADAYVAVKVCISDKTVASQEKEIIQQLLLSSDGRASMILPILGSFILQGPNGQHPCLVTPPARMSLASAKSATHGYNIFRLPVARAIAAQLAQALAFCHSQGVVHGDLHAGNVLLRFAADDEIYSLSRSAFYERFGEPLQEPVELIDGTCGGGGPPPALDRGVPTHGVIEAWLGCRPQEVTLAESVIYLADLGESYVAAGPGAQARTYCHAPPRVTPPEAHFASDELGFPADVWALACVMWDIFAGSGSLFGSPFSRGDDELRRDWVYVLGRLPDEWWDAWAGDYRRDRFREDGTVREDRQDYFLDCEPGLEGCFELMVQGPRREEDMQEVSNEEKTVLLEMLRQMLAYKPSERIKAQDILKTEWMLSYDLPALDDLKRLA